jgi:alginate O-acetyltransferase complex protein AlgI
VQWAHAGRHLAQVFDSKPRWIRWPAYYALIVTILCIGQLGARSFIYFQF